MKQVKDIVIDKIIEQLDQSEEHFDKALAKATEEQPMLFSYLASDSFDLLNEDERGYLMYIGLIMYMSYKEINPNMEDVSEDMIGEAEEENYRVLETAKGDTFIDQLDVFFEGYPQEELLALAEEAILEDEDDEETIITEEGVEPIFIGLKSIIDAMIAATP